MKDEAMRLESGDPRRSVRGGKTYIGTSGWHYRHWVGAFYPRSLEAEGFLGWYARRLRSVEINNTFYRLPDPEVLADWYDCTPDGFIFACKASRYITHMKKLKDPEQATRRFFDVIGVLGAKLGPVLFQLPPHWGEDSDRLDEFLTVLPRAFRYAFEFRDPSWFTSKVYRVLVRHRAAFCIYDLDRQRSPVLVTANFVYIRLHGPDGPYRGKYDGRTLYGWTRRMSDWCKTGLDVYCYFDNDEAGYAAQNAEMLAEMVAKANL